jgi:hypothetical protein
VGERAEDGRGG